MSGSIIQRVVLSAAFVAGGWLAATVAHGEGPKASNELADLKARVAALESWQAHAGTFTQEASGDWSFAPPKGSVSIAPATGNVSVQPAMGNVSIRTQKGNVSIESAQATTVKSTTTLSFASASTLTAKAASLSIEGDAQVSVSGALLSLNKGGHPLLDATAVPVGFCPPGGGPLMNASLAGGTVPTVLVP
jgi:uncharacterized protein (DUF2345 family)